MKKSDASATTDGKELEKVTAQLGQAQAQAEEWKTKYLRVLADYQNLDKRSQGEKRRS